MMKKFLFMLIMLIAPMTVAMAEENDNVYMVADEMPRFEKGDLKQWIATNVERPTSVHGLVMVKFVITEDGSVGRIKVTKSLCADADSAAVRVIRALPHFVPAKNSGTPVSVWHMERIKF